MSDPIARGVDVIGLTWFSILIKVGALSGLTTVILVLLYGQSRIFLTMSQDGLLPRMFAHLHPRLNTPYRSQILIGVIVAAVAPSCRSTCWVRWSASARCSPSSWCAVP